MWNKKTRTFLKNLPTSVNGYGTDILICIDRVSQTYTQACGMRPLITRTFLPLFIFYPAHSSFATFLGSHPLLQPFYPSKYLIRLVFVTHISPDFFWMLLHDFLSYFPDSETYLFHIRMFLKSKWLLQWICPFTPTIVLFSQITVIKSMTPVGINDLKQREQETWLLWQPQGEICCVEIMVKSVWAVVP